MDGGATEAVTPSGVICYCTIGTLHSWRSAAPCCSVVYKHGTPAECSTASHDGTVKQRSGVYVPKSHS
jgi:hypothetical protein